MEREFEFISRRALGYITEGSHLLATTLKIPKEFLDKDIIRYHTTASDQTTDQLTASLAIYFLSVFVAVTAVDLLISRPLTFLLAGRGNTRKYSWFLLHALFNAMITVVSLEEAYLCATNPISNAFGPNMWYGTYPAALFGAIAIGTFHIHHFVFYPVTREDVIHHCVNAGAVVLAGVYLPWGRCAALSNVPMCGIPGGINYFVLWLQKSTGLISSSAQKFENRLMNILVRLPVQLMSFYIILLGLCTNVIVSVPQVTEGVKWLMLIAAAVHTANAFYYADQVVGNFHVFHATKKEGGHAKKE